MAKRKPNGYWTLERCKDDAKRFSTRLEWRRGGGGGYPAARRNGWRDECCTHMPSHSESMSASKTKWTAEYCKEDAHRFLTRSEWQRESDSAYRAALRGGFLDECCEHMERAGGTDNDVVYIWRDAGTDLHKIGVTSDRTGSDRIGKCGSRAGMDPRIVLMLKVDDARAVEAELLQLGTDPELDSSIDGYTEFRVLTNEELGKAVSTAYQYAVAA